MKKLLGIMVLGLLLSACAPNSEQSPSQMNLKSKLNFPDSDYKFAFLELWHTSETTKKYAWQIMPPGNKAYAVSQFAVWNKDRNFGAGPTFFAFSDRNINEAKSKSINFCKASSKQSKYLFTGSVDPNSCKIHIAYTSENPKKSIKEIKAENDVLNKKKKADRYTKRCENLGILKTSEQMTNCINEFYNAETKITKTKTNSNFKDIILTLLVLDAALYQPSVSYRKPNCFFNSVAYQSTGGLGFITCN